MAVPYTFGTATAAIPLSQLDTNFATAITIGNTAVQLGNTVTTLNNMTLANVTISSGNVTLTNVSVTTANVTTANIVNSIITTGETLSYGTANGVAYLNTSKVVTTGSALVFDGTNLGIGVTPSAWRNTYNAFQIGIGGALFGRTATQDQVNVSANYYVNTSNVDTYLGTGYATLYKQNAGQHQWYNAASGTAGNAITFTQAMTLDASGNLGTNGQTSPGTFQNAGITIGTGNTNYGVNIYSSSSALGDICFAKASSGSGLYNGMLRYSHASDAMSFWTASTERARIDSSGNLLVNNTGTITAGPTSKVISYAGSASTAAIAAQYGNSYTGQLYRADSYTASGTGWAYFMGLSGNGSSVTTTQIQILGNGNIQNTNNSYGAISDVKLKENIVDASPKLEQLNQIRVVNYNLIGDDKKQLGVIAQELEQIFPSMIEETPDRDMEGNDLGTTTKSVKYSVFVPMLIKAIQEQQALITSLTERISALEAK